MIDCKLTIARFAVFICLMMSVGQAYSVAFVPLSVSGGLSYSYGFSRSASNSGSENNSITTNVSMTAYIWQPWFITNSFGLSFGVTRSAAKSGGASKSNSVGGRFGFDVFPRSRVPFNFSYSRGDNQSQFENGQQSFTANKYTSSQLLMRQSYYGRGGDLVTASWSHAESKTGSLDADNDTLTVRMIKRIPKHSLSGLLVYSTHQTSSSISKPENLNLSLSHGYVPGTNINVSSGVGVNQSKVSSLKNNPNVESDSSSVQANSFFSWRPEFTPLGVSGGARISSSSLKDSKGTRDNLSAGLSIGASYKLSNRTSMNANANAALSEVENEQSSSFSQAASVSYSSDQYSLVGFDYSWGSSMSINNSVTDTDQGRNSNQGAGISLSHRASRMWPVGRASSLNIGLSQAGALSGSETDVGSNTAASASHSVVAGLSTRGVGGSTYMSWSFSDSRALQGTKANYQQVGMTLSRSQTINRLSRTSGAVVLQSSTQSVAGQESNSTTTATANGQYSHSRFFGVFNMQYNSSISYSHPMNDKESDNETTQWTNNVDYRIGLLAMSMSLNVNKRAGAEPSMSFYFRATRTF